MPLRSRLHRTALPAAVALCALFLAGTLAAAPPARAADDDWLTGVDVSGHQHPGGAPIDWARVADAGQRFAIVKATEYRATGDGAASLYTNPYLHQDLEGARAAGLVVGAYAFAHPDQPAALQADQLAAAVGVLPDGSLPPVLDLETTGGLSPAALVEWTGAFLDRLEHDTGVVPMIYASPNFWWTALGGSTAFTRYPLWVAHYTGAASPRALGGWHDWDVWQFSSSGSVPGISGDVDLDRVRAGALTSLAQRVGPPTVGG